MFPSVSSFRLELQGHSHPCHTHMTTLWVMVMKLRSSDQAGKERDLKVCHVWKLPGDCISGYTAAEDRLVTTAGSSALRHFQWKWHWLWLSCVFCLWVLMQRCFISWHHDILHVFDFQSHIWAPPLEYGSLSSHWFSNWEWDLGAARHRQPPFFPFVRHNDDLTGSRMPTSAPLFSPDFINWKAAVNYQSIF